MMLSSGEIHADFRHSGTVYTKSYSMNAASTSFQRHERGIDVVSATAP
jgi:hypothetical protein